MLDVTSKLTHIIYTTVVFEQQNLATLFDAQDCLLLLNPKQSMSSCCFVRYLTSILHRYRQGQGSSTLLRASLQKNTPVQLQLAHSHHASTKYMKHAT